MKPDDQQLIDDCLSGCGDAFGELVLRYQDRLFNTLVTMLGCAEEAQDVAQDAFVNAFQKLESFRGESAFYSWLFRIALNAAVSRKRKNRKAKISLDAVQDRSGIEPVDHHPERSPSYSIEVSERQILVREALQQLPVEFRTPLVLKEMEGLKYEEIADIVGCPIGTVRSRIHRARAELREKLALMLKDE